jgi:hypothetical protein
MMLPYLLVSFLATVAAAQTQTIIALPSEPHHRTVLSNPYIRLYQVVVSPKDSVQLHRHEYDAISIMNGDAEVNVHTPGRADAPAKLSNGQVRLQPAGYIHSTEITGDKIYRNVTVELLRPQQNQHNLCATVMANQPLVCPDQPPATGPADIPQFITNQTYVSILRLGARQEINRARSSQPQLPHPQLLVALDEGEVVCGPGADAKTLRHPGDFAWLDHGGSILVLKNNGDKEVRLVSLLLKP